SAGLSDRLGRKHVMLGGLVSSAAGVLMFAVAGEVYTLMAGRVLMGIGVGLSAGPSAAALVDYAGKGGTARSASVTLSAQSVGFAGALLLAGALVTWAPLPTRLSFYVLFALLLVLLLLCLFIPADRPSDPTHRLLARHHVPPYPDVSSLLPHPGLWGRPCMPLRIRVTYSTDFTHGARCACLTWTAALKKK
ncbi:MFS transporter, partial [Klebsiella quasipneumoniae]